MKVRLSRHAEKEMNRRGIPLDLVESLLRNPQQVIEQLDGKKVFQSQLDLGSGKIFLLRAIVIEFADYEVDPFFLDTVLGDNQ